MEEEKKTEIYKQKVSPIHKGTYVQQTNLDQRG